MYQAQHTPVLIKRDLNEVVRTTRNQRIGFGGMGKEKRVKEAQDMRSVPALVLRS